MSTIPDIITTVYRHYYTTQYVQLSSLTFLLWDYIVTLPDEIELFWTGKWSWPRVLFFVNRYQVIGWQILHTIGLFMVSRPGQFCQVWMHSIITLSAFAMIIPIQLILSLRIYGIYNHAKWMLWILTAMFLASAAAQLYIVIRLSPDVTRIAMPFSNITCEPTPGAAFRLHIGPILAVAFDLPAFLLVLLRGLSLLRVQRSFGFRGSILVRLLLRDSILYFFVILVAHSAIVTSLIKLPDIETFTAFGYGFSIISVTATRILINLKEL